MKKVFRGVCFLLTWVVISSCTLKRDNPYDINNPNYVTCTIPTNLNFNPVTYNSMALSWESVPNAAYYNVQYQNAGLYSNTWTTVTTYTNSYTLANLEASSAYNFQVQAICSNGSNTGQSAYSDQSSFYTSECPAPTNLNATNITTSTAYISWSAVPGFTSYTVQYQNYTTYVTLTVSSSTNSCTLTGLTTGTYYSVQVETSCSGFGNQINFTTN